MTNKFQALNSSSLENTAPPPLLMAHADSGMSEWENALKYSKDIPIRFLIFPLTAQAQD